MSCPANCDKPKCPSRKVDFATDKPIIWVLGGPGAGKGTQCKKIIAKYGFTHLSTGDLLRAEVQSGSERSKPLAAIMAKGNLVPNDIVLNLLKEAILKEATTTKGFLIDGYPREKAQGIAFEKVVGPATKVLYFDTTSETMKQRMLSRAATSGRIDDNEEAINIRLKTFIDNNEDVMSQYNNKMIRINAERDVDTIFNEVQTVLDDIVSKK